MALQQQPQAAPPAGGLNQARPQQPPQAPAPKQENLAARAAGMVQEEDTAAAPEDFFTKTMMDLQKQRAALNSQTEKLLSSLDARQNRLFDPMLMKVASGFLAPTKTGSFGESLGYAASAATEEAEKEFARQQQMEKLKYELMQKQVEQSEAAALQGILANELGFGAAKIPANIGAQGAPATPQSARAEGAPVTPGAPGVAAPPTTVSMASQAAPATSTGAPRQMPLITDQTLTRVMMADKSGKYSGQLANIAKLQQENEVVTPEGIYNKSTKTLTPFPDKTVKLDIPTLFEKPLEVPYGVYKQWEAIHNSGDRAKELEFMYSRGWLQRPAGAKPGEIKEPPTPGERAADAAVIAERRKEQVKEEAARIGKLEGNFESSREFINTARGMRELATSNARAFDLMNDDGVALGVMRAAKQGLSAGSLGNFSIPTDVVYQGAKLSKEDREALQMFAREYANLTVNFRKAARVPGEGATTEREGDLYAALGALPTDTARVIRMKAEFLENKGKYDQEVFRAWNKFSKDPKNSYRDFLASDELQSIKDAYDKRLGEIQRANSDVLGRRAKPAEPAKPTAPATPSKPAPQQASAPGVPPKKGSPAYNSLPEGGLFEDTDGTIRRKKKE